jgi:hypothetical protein
MKQAMNLAKLKIWNWWKTSQPQRVGIYGGKFDPPHVGHLMCAEMTREAFHLDKVLIRHQRQPSSQEDRRLRCPCSS